MHKIVLAKYQQYFRDTLVLDRELDTIGLVAKADAPLSLDNL